MLRPTRGLLIAYIVAMLIAPALLCAQETQPAAKAPPERTYSNMPFVHRIPLLDEQGATIRLPKPGEEAVPGATNTNPVSLAHTCGKCHSDYDVMQRGYHFNFADPNAP